MYSLLALYLRGYSLHHPIMAQGLDGFDAWTIVENDMRRLECCQSPVWDTCLALVALADAGLDEDDPQMVAGARWLLDQEVQVVGDWAEQRPHLAPGGWAFEFENNYYPRSGRHRRGVPFWPCAASATPMPGRCSGHWTGR